MSSGDPPGVIDAAFGRPRRVGEVRLRTSGKLVEDVPADSGRRTDIEFDACPSRDTGRVNRPPAVVAGEQHEQIPRDDARWHRDVVCRYICSILDVARRGDDG